LRHVVREAFDKTESPDGPYALRFRRIDELGRCMGPDMP
jgi:hypothetical protein